MSDRKDGQLTADEEYFDSTANGIAGQNQNNDEDGNEEKGSRHLNMEDDRSRDNIHQGSQTEFNDGQRGSSQILNAGSDEVWQEMAPTHMTAADPQNKYRRRKSGGSEFSPTETVAGLSQDSAEDGLLRRDHPSEAADVSAIQVDGLLGRTDIPDHVPGDQAESIEPQPAATVSSGAEVIQAPEQITLSGTAINEDAAIGDTLGTVSAIDPEGATLSYSLSDDAGGMFSIDSETGEITLAGPLDYETLDNYDLTVDVSDGVNVTQQTFNISVQDDFNDPGLQGSANIIGTDGDDTDDTKLMGTNQVDDVIYGLGGNDDIMGKNGRDTLVGGEGDDTVKAGQGDDVVYGGEGADDLRGQGGDDTIYGGSGADQITAGVGDDDLHGGSGNDYVNGGAGSDIFHFGMLDGNDTFVGGNGGGWSDTIMLSDGMPEGEISDWLSLTSGTVESTAEGDVFLSEDAAGTITLGNDSVLTFEGVEKIEG